MPNSGPIILIEDDEDDMEMMKDIMRDLKVKNQLECFTLTMAAFDYLKHTSKNPFLIICDMNLPMQNGIEFKRELDKDKELRKKSIPFIFYSTAVDEHLVELAYIHMAVQGYFKKGNDYEQMRELMRLIIGYWKLCRHPNSD
ncbi:MAG: response regulator [Bacteroidota bacterium]